MLSITFSNEDREGLVSIHDDPMVILVVMVSAKVRKVFTDQESSVDIFVHRIR